MNNIIEELAFMDEKLDKILEQQNKIMRKLGIMDEEEYIADEDFDFTGSSMDCWFRDVMNKLNDISVIKR